MKTKAKVGTVFKTFIIAILFPFTLLALENNQSLSSTQMKKVKAGETVYSILKKLKFSNSEINLFLSHNEIPRNIKLIPGSLYKYTRHQNNNKAVKFYELDKDVSYNLERQGKKTTAFVKEENFIKKVKTAEGKVKGSIVGSLQKKTNNKSISYRFLDAYAFNHNLRRELKRNAYFSIVYEEKYDGDFYIKPGEVLKTQIEIDGDIKTRHFIPFEDGGSFLAQGLSLQERPFFAPVNYVRISSYYNPRRFHPIKKRRIPHHGIDFELPKGAPVFTVQKGVVLRSGRNRAAGNYIVIRHSNGLESYYNHLSRIEKNIRPGYKVRNGEPIGAIGCTGYCTKAHLHFAVKKFGRFVNPIKFLKSYPFNKEHLVLAKRQKLNQEKETVIR